MAVMVMTQPKGDSDGATILPRIEWATKSAKLMRIERYKDGNDAWVTKKHDITLMTVTNKDGDEVLQRPAMLFDFASGANAWVRFKPYDEIVVALDGTLPPQPKVYRDEAGNTVTDAYGKTVQHDQMLRVPVYSPKVFGAEQALHELSCKGNIVVAAIAALFEEKVEQAPEYLAGKLPLIQWTGSEAMGKKGDLFKPIFKVLQWVDRPADVPLDRKPARADESLYAGVPVKPAAPVKIDYALAAALAAKNGGGAGALLDDEIPFGAEFR